MLTNFRISASSYKTFKACTRRWWWAKVRGVPEPEQPHLQLGSDVHSVCEDYLRGRIELPPESRAGRIAGAGWSILGDLRCQVEHVEAPVRGRCGEIPYLGYLDMLDTRDPWIGDHKTSSNIGRWGENEYTLAYNDQLLFYSYAAFRELRPAVVKLTHVYYATKGRPRSVRVDSEVSWDRVEDKWSQFVAVGAEMLQLATVSDQSEVPYDTTACHAYGRECPYATICKRGQ